MTVSRKCWVQIWNVAVGSMDASTGILLMIAPSITLQMMGIEVAVDVLPFIGWLGAFVFSVGGCYFLALGAACDQRKMVWRMTALVRSVVAGYLIYGISTGLLGSGWVTVAATDGLVALVQWIGLKRGCLS